MRNCKSKIVLLTGTLLSSALTLSLPAFAQDNTNETTNADTNAQVDILNLEEDTVKDTVVVTGSRIRRDEFTSSAPVQIITAETSSLQGLLKASEILQGASVAAGSGQINDTFTGFVVNGGAGINTLSLRGLGSQRTLVLLNGRRIGPAGISGTVGPVDLNVLPNSSILRQELLKDGASSIYGSDAVAGVANVITKNNLEGFNVGASVNVTEHGGGESGAIWGSYGKTTDLTTFNISAEYNERKSLKIGDRDLLACPQDYIFNEAGERTDAIDSRTGEFKCYNSLEGYIQTFFPGDAPFGIGGGFFGSRVPDPTATGGAASPIDGYRFIPFFERSNDDPRELETDAISPSKNYTLFGEATYTPTQFDDLEIYTEFLLNRRESEQKSFRQLFPIVPAASSINPLGVPFNYDLCGSFAVPCGDPRFNVTLNGLDARPIILADSDRSQNVNYLRGVAGIRGTFNSDNFLSGWNYDLAAIRSKSDGEYFQNVLPADRFNSGIGVDDRTGAFIGVCGPTAPAGCMPLPIFEPRILFDGDFTDAELDYFFVDERGQTEYMQTMIEGIVTGDLFKMPAGTVGAAFGVSARWDEIDDKPGSVSAAANSYNSASASRTAGSDTVYEVFGEVEVPLIRGKAFAEDLSFNGSARFSDYDSVGSAFTYKAGLNWALNDTIRLRGTYGTSFRAPALYELFLQNQTGFLQQNSVDPCIRYGVPGEDGNINTPQVVQDNCAADGLPVDYAGGSSSARITRNGGLGILEPEDSDAFTVGFVLTPKDLGLSLAVEYFDIEVNNQIGSFAAGVVGACYRDEDFRSVPGFCDLFERDLDPASPTFGNIDEIDASYRNIPSLRTSGFDITTRYEHDFNFGNLIIDSQVTITDREESQLFEEVLDYNGTDGEPEIVGNAQARFGRGDWTYTWTTNFTKGTDNLGFEGEDGMVDFFYSGPSTQITAVDDFWTHDFSVRKVWDTARVTIGVSNVFDTDPSRLSTGDDAGTARRFGNYPFSSQYFEGYLGRQFFLTVEKDF